MSFDLQRLQQALHEQPGVLETGRRSQAGLPGAELVAFPDLNPHVFDTVASTNTVAWELLQQGAGGGTVVIALTQQAGRGQRGHRWNSPRGGLYLSLGLTSSFPVAQAGGLTLSSAWGIATVLHSFDIPVKIKWPNDLVVAGQKLGGILAETRSARGYIHQAVIGVGINWSNPVPEAGVNLQTVQADLQESSIDSLELLAAIVLRGLKLGYCTWQQQGLEHCATAYETLLTHLGNEVVIDNQPGTIMGITPTGQLRVQLHTPDRREICLESGAICLGYGKS